MQSYIHIFIYLFIYLFTI